MGSVTFTVSLLSKRKDFGGMDGIFHYIIIIFKKTMYTDLYIDVLIVYKLKLNFWMAKK